MNATQIIALAVGGYFLYQYFYGSGAAEDNGQPAGDGSASGGSSTASVSHQIKTLGANDASAVAGKLNFWQWNYYYTQVTGKSGPDPFQSEYFAGYNAQGIENAKLFYEQWLDIAKSIGVTGLGYVPMWWTQNNFGSGVAQETATGFERSVKRLVN